MAFLSYYDIFGIVLVSLYLVLSWLFPKRTEEKEELTVRSEKESLLLSKSLHEGVKGDSGSLNQETSFKGEEGDKLECDDPTFQSSLLTTHSVQIVQEVVQSPSSNDANLQESTYSPEFTLSNDESSIEERSDLIEDDSLRPFQVSEHSQNTTTFCSTSKLSEVSSTTTDTILSFSQTEEEDKKKTGDITERKGMPEIIQIEKNALNSCMECHNYSEDTVGLSLSDATPAKKVSDSIDNPQTAQQEFNLPTNMTIVSKPWTDGIESQVEPEAPYFNDYDSLSPPPSPSSKKDNLQKFADDVACSAIKTAVDNTVCLNTFAEELSEKIFSDSEDVLSEVHTCTDPPEINKELELEKLETLSTCVASEVVSEAVGEAALKEDIERNENSRLKDDVNYSQEIQPHISFVVENVVNNAICEATSKLKRDLEMENGVDSLVTELIGLDNQSKESETHYNNVSELEFDIASDTPILLKPDADSIDDQATGQIIKPFVCPDNETLEDTEIISSEAERELAAEQVEPAETILNESAETCDKNITDALIEDVTATLAKTDADIPEGELSVAKNNAGINAESNNDKPGVELSVLTLTTTGDLTESNNALHVDLKKETVDETHGESYHQYPTVPEIKITSDEGSAVTSDNISEDETSSTSSPEIEQQKVTLRNKDDKKRDGKDNFWRKSLILDLEEEFDEFDESISREDYDETSPKISKPAKEITPDSDEQSTEDFTDSEEDEIIDYDAESALGAVGGSKELQDQEQIEHYDLYDYESSDDDDESENVLDPVFTVDGLCIGKPAEKKGKLMSVGSHYNRAIVLDNGCGSIKVGYAGDRVPRVIEPNVAGFPQRLSMHITGMETDLKDYKKYGDEAVSKAGVMHLSHPMKAGLIDNWADIEDVWEYMIYDQLGAEVSDNPVIVTEVVQNPKKNREKIAEILFEHLNVPAMYLADQLSLSMYASGLTSGVCLSSGYSCTQAAVVYEGHTLPYTLQQLDIAGGQLTEHLKILLRDLRAKNFTTSSGMQIVNDIKEKHAFIAKDYAHTVEKYKQSDALTQYYKLPDGEVVEIGYECMTCVEPLFRPDTLTLADSTTASQQPVHRLINDAINKCDSDLQDLCYKHIILSGGTTTLKGFTSRLQHELQRINHRIRKIRTPDHRKYSPWIGGSILGTLAAFDEQYVTLDEYGDFGAQIVHKKCF